MKVIKAPEGVDVETWKYTTICGVCDAELEIGLSDLKAKPGYKAARAYYQCPVCGCNNNLDRRVLSGLTATLDELRAHHDELRKNAMPTNCTLCRGSGAAPDEAGPCERCGGWTQHKRLVAAEPDELRKRIAELQQRAACDAETISVLRDGWEEERRQLHARIRERNNECDRIQRALNQCAEERDQLRKRVAELEARIVELQRPSVVLEALRERAEWAEAMTASLLPYQERAVLAEKASAEMREILSALVYWHDQGIGHIDASWWDAARKLVEDGHGR